MEIIGKPISPAIDAYAPAAAAGGRASGRREPAAGGGSDRVVLSPRAKEILEARQKAEALPDVDAAKVHEIRQRIDAGTYAIDGRAVAMKMIGESVFSQMV